MFTYLMNIRDIMVLISYFDSNIKILNISSHKHYFYKCLKIKYMIQLE